VENVNQTILHNTNFHDNIIKTVQQKIKKQNKKHLAMSMIRKIKNGPHLHMQGKKFITSPASLKNKIWVWLIKLRATWEEPSIDRKL